MAGSKPMSERNPNQTTEERLASVETKTERLVQEVDAGRIENQAAFKELRVLINKNDVSMRADTQAMESRLRSEIEGTEDKLRSEIKDTEVKLRSEIKDTEDKLRSEIKDTEHNLRSEIKGTEHNLRSEIDRSEERLRDHMNTNTSTILSHVRLVAGIMVPVSLGVLGLLAKVIFDSG